MMPDRFDSQVLVVVVVSSQAFEQNTYEHICHLVRQGVLRVYTSILRGNGYGFNIGPLSR